jgi:hypothetical protein
VKVDLVRTPDHDRCVIVGRGRRRGEDNHVRTACNRFIQVTMIGIEIEYEVAESTALPKDVCHTCCPRPQLSLFSGAK